MLPDGRGWLLVEFGGETKEESDEKARALMRDLEKRRRAAVGDEAVRRPRQRAAHLGGARGGARRDGVRPGQGGHARGLGGLRRSARAARRVPPPPLEARREVRLRELALRPLRPGLRPRPLELRPGHEARHREVPALARGRERPRARARRLVVRGARRRPVARGAPPEDVRRRPRPRLRGVQVDLGSRLEDEPGQGRPARTASTRTSASAPTTSRGGRRSSSATRATTATSRTRPSAASASASAARPTGSTSCARRSWRRARRCTRPAAARVSCSRCSKGRSSPTAGSRTR